MLKSIWDATKVPWIYIVLALLDTHAPFIMSSKALQDIDVIVKLLAKLSLKYLGTTPELEGLKLT